MSYKLLRDNRLRGVGQSKIMCMRSLRHLRAMRLSFEDCQLMQLHKPSMPRRKLTSTAITKKPLCEVPSARVAQEASL